MKRFSTLLFIFFAAIVFSPVGYSQFRLPTPGLDVSITVPSDVQNGAFTARIRFTEEVLDFVQSDVILTGTATASITGWASTDDLIFNATITPVTSGTVIIGVPTDVATDAGGTQNNAATPQTVTVDVDAPSVGITVPSVAQSGAFEATITFTESVSDFEQSDLTLSGTATVSITAWVSTDDTVFTATITPTTEGDVVLSVAADVATDAASNNNTASETQTVTIDMTSPGVSLSVPADAQNSAFEATITFTESVSDFEQSDLTLSGTATASITAWAMTDDTTYTATITPTTEGDVVLSVMANVATDAASNNNTAAETQTVTIDMTSPGVSLSVPADAQNSAFEATITFTESVSDFEQSDLTLSGTATASITAWATTDDTTYTATLTPTTGGEVTLSVAANVATDAASNNNTAAETQTVTVDMTSPGVSLSVPADAQNSAFDVTITFTESVSDFEQSDLTLSGTATASITAWATTDDTVWTATLTPTASGTLTLSIAAGAVTDTAGNTNVLSTAQVSITMNVPDDTEVCLAVFVSVCDRTPQVRDAIVAAVPNVSDCANVTAADLATITSLALRSENITALKVGDFCGLTSLTRLWLNYNDLSSLPSGIFDDLTSLEQLDLYCNDLSSLPAGIFDDLTALEQLELANNDLGSLSAGIFDDLTSLTRLWLSNNDLSSLPSGIFDDLTSLEQLDLYGNDLSSLPSGIFDDLTSLTRLWLSNNDLSSLPSGIFDDLTALEQLYLARNDLSSLPSGIFDDLTALEQLYLARNDLSSLPSGIFDDLTALEQLDLQNNDLISVPDGIFKGLTSLNTLYLQNNDLSSVPDGIFEGLTSLNTLYLQNNDLSSVPDGIFEGLTSLLILDLSGNTVNPLPLTVSLKQIEEGQFKATVPTGAPFNMALSISVVNGSITGGTDSITIPVGKIESETFTVTRTPGTTGAVLVDIETLPLPLISGYEFVKSTDLPLTVINALGNAAPRMTPVDEVPSETTLSANYPNPFNPETWIPYQLSNTSDVKITIYDMRGSVVRRLELGHQREGYYTSRSRAAYWDGKNNVGERVASGIYFYQLQAGNISLLRKMVILQ